jgi:hypothetical protein
MRDPRDRAGERWQPSTWCTLARVSVPSARANPYRTPESALHELEQRLERRLVLKFYFGLAIAAALWRGVAALSVEPARLPDLGGVALIASALPALFGYAFRRRLGRPWLWKLALPLPLAGAALTELDFVPLYLGTAGPLHALAKIYVRLFDAPLIAALFLYAFRSPELWRSERG